MKRYFELLYWIVMIPAMSLVFMSVMGSFGAAFFLSVMMMPGILFVKYFIKDLSFRDRRRGIIDAVYFAGAALAIEYLAIFLVYWVLIDEGVPETAGIMLNPAFICFILASLLSIEQLLKIKFFREDEPEKYVTFTSERRKVSLEADRIAYVESMDYEVRVVTVCGTAYPTRMKISQWEAALDDRFLRVHRSFIVNRMHVSRFDHQTVHVGELPIYISRKYRENALEKLAGQP